MSMANESIQESGIAVDPGIPQIVSAEPAFSQSAALSTVVPATATADRSSDLRITVAGIRTTHATRAQLASMMVRDCLRARLDKSRPARLAFSSNGRVISRYHSDPEFRSLILQADIVDADGMPVVFASRLFCKQPLVERTATTDFIQDASDAAVRNDLRFFFLGGQEGVAQSAVEKLRENFPALQISGVRHGYFDRKDEARICKEVVATGTDVLWVGLGSPKQEAFAVRNRALLEGVGWIRTCGGMFDHVAKRFHRAPRWIQASGFEWLVRAAQEPRRLGTQYLKSNPSAAFHLITKTHD